MSTKWEEEAGTLTPPTMVSGPTGSLIDPETGKRTGRTRHDELKAYRLDSRTAEIICRCSTPGKLLGLVIGDRAQHLDLLLVLAGETSDGLVGFGSDATAVCRCGMFWAIDGAKLRQAMAEHRAGRSGRNTGRSRPIRLDVSFISRV